MLNIPVIRFISTSVQCNYYQFFQISKNIFVKHWWCDGSIHFPLHFTQSTCFEGGGVRGGLVVVGGWEWNCKDKDAPPSTAHKCFIFIMFFTFFVQTNQLCCKFWFVFAFLHFRIYDLWLIFSINVLFAAISKPNPLSSLQMSKSVIQSHIRTLFFKHSQLSVSNKM